MSSKQFIQQIFCFCFQAPNVSPRESQASQVQLQVVDLAETLDLSSVSNNDINTYLLDPSEQQDNQFFYSRTHKKLATMSAAEDVPSLAKSAKNKLWVNGA